MNYSKLKEAVKRSKLQRKDLATMADITPKTIDNILSGADTKVSTLEAIAKAVGIKMSILFDESVEIREAGRDYVEKGKIEYKGTEQSVSNSIEQDLRDQITQLKSQLADKERIIELMERRK